MTTQWGAAAGGRMLAGEQGGLRVTGAVRRNTPRKGGRRRQAGKRHGLWVDTGTKLGPPGGFPHGAPQAGSKGAKLRTRLGAPPVCDQRGRLLVLRGVQGSQGTLRVCGPCKRDRLTEV